MTEDEITNEARSEFDKDALWQAKDTIREANIPERDKTSLLSSVVSTGGKNLISEVASAGDKLDRIKHLIKRLDVHQVISNEKAHKTNILLLFLSVVMALQAAIYIYDKVSNNYGNIGRLDMSTPNFDLLFFIVLEILLLYIGYKVFVFGADKILGKEKYKEKDKEIVSPRLFQPTIWATFVGTILGLVIIAVAAYLLFSSLTILRASIEQKQSKNNATPAVHDTTSQSDTLSKRIIVPQSNKKESEVREK